MYYNPPIPQDSTLLPGMHTIMADASDSYEVVLTKDIVYVERPEENLVLHLLTNERANPEGQFPGKKPLLVYVQGSAWMEQDTYFRIPTFTDAVRAGYTVAFVKYRAATKAKWPAFLLDVKSAIRYLRANAEKYGIDSENVAIWGDSSGGNTALLVGVTGDMEEFKTDDNKEYSDAVKCVIDFYGPTDCAKINDKPRNPIFTADKNMIPEDILFGACIVEHPEAAQPGNPVNYVTEEKPLPPIFIAHGDWDDMVPFNQSVLMYQKLKECGKVCEFYKVIGAGHGIHLWNKNVFQKAMDFLGAYIYKK